jgi:DNA (cytosine-5)-methyltransferase 1
MRVLSLFCGAGGMDLGFVRAGHEIVWANDIWTDAVATYRNNFCHHVEEAPIETISAVPNAEIVIGGFPCQGFSVANWQRSTTDRRNKLYLELLRTIAEKQPRYFVAENVKGLLSLAGGRVFRRILGDLSELGYEVLYAVLNAADYGVPQRRYRVFIIGTKVGQPRPTFPPPRTHAPADIAPRLGLLPWVGVGAALADLPAPGSDSSLANHEDFSAYKLRFNGHLGHRHVDPWQPAPTITARGDDRGGVVVIHHPNNLRRISPREAATIQSFPRDFVFLGSRTSVYRQVANAVPPLLAQRVAECIPLSLSDAGPEDRTRIASASRIEQLSLLSSS